MKNFLYLFIALVTVSIMSCNDDIGKINITYQEASAVYGDLEEIRATPLNDVVQSVNNPGKIYVSNNYIFLGEEEKGIHVINNINASNPVHVNFIAIPGNREFFVKDEYLYAESYYDVLKINISNPENAILEGRAEFVFQEEFTNDAGETLLGFSFTEVSKELDQDSDFYNEIMTDRIVYLDFAQNIIPKSAVPSSFAGNSNQQSGTVNRITHAKDHVYVIGNTSMNIIDDSGSAFEKVSGNQTFWAPNDMETIFPYEDKLFIGSRSSMTIYDISNPEQPSEDYIFDHATACDPVLPIDEVAYITLRTADFSSCPGNTNALIVLDIEQLNNPEQVNEIEMKSPYGMTLIANLLFVGEGENGLSIFNVVDRQNPVLVKTVENLSAYDVIQHPGNPGLVLIAGPNGLEQYSINNNLDFSFESRIDF